MISFSLYLSLDIHFHFIFRGKNFEKGSEYANTWNKDDDGKVNTDGPRVVVGDQGGFQGQMITRYLEIANDSFVHLGN